jgi:hypothetical protein
LQQLGSAEPVWFEWCFVICCHTPTNAAAATGDRMVMWPGFLQYMHPVLQAVSRRQPWWTTTP